MVGKGQIEARYPDMQLYEEIIFLNQWFKGLWVVENVIPYYKLLIPAKKIDRHLFWSNFGLGNFEPKIKKMEHDKSTIPHLEELLGFDLSGYKLKNKLKCLRNCVRPETGKYIMDCAMKFESSKDETQLSMFDSLAV